MGDASKWAFPYSHCTKAVEIDPLNRTYPRTNLENFHIVCDRDGTFSLQAREALHRSYINVLAKGVLPGGVHKFTVACYADSIGQV